MKQIPKTKDALVLRTDFSDQAIWEDENAAGSWKTIADSRREEISEGTADAATDN